MVIVSKKQLNDIIYEIKNSIHSELKSIIVENILKSPSNFNELLKQSLSHLPN